MLGTGRGVYKSVSGRREEGKDVNEVGDNAEEERWSLAEKILVLS